MQGTFLKKEQHVASGKLLKKMRLSLSDFRVASDQFSLKFEFSLPRVNFVLLFKI